MTIEKYQEAVKKVKERIAQFKKANTEDEKRLEEVKGEYEQAVNSFQDSKADKLHGELSTLKQNLDNRKRQIEILSKDDNPNIVKAANEEILESLNSIQEIKKKSDLQLKEIEKAKENYALAVKSYREMAREADGYNDIINQLVGKADDKTVGKLTSNNIKVARMGNLNLSKMKSTNEFNIENLTAEIEKLEGGK